MAIYNLTAIDNSSNFIDIARATSDLTDGWLFVIFMATFMLILFVAQKGYKTTVAAISTFAIGSLTSILFLALGVLPFWFVVIPILGLIATIMTHFVSAGD